MTTATWSTRAAWPAQILLHMPDDGHKYELVDGVLVREVMTAPHHGLICNRLGRVLGDYVDQHGFPHAVVQNTLFDITPPGATHRTVLAPDVALMADLTTPAFIPEAMPFLAVEVISPSQTLAELGDKARIYLAAGTPEVWLVDPATHVVEIWNAQGTLVLNEQQPLTSSLLPGFQADIAWLMHG